MKIKIHPQIKIHLKNINKSEKYKTEHDGAQKRHEH